MCVAAIAWHAHPRWQLVAIGNRDEYHDRPAAPLARWPDDSGILAGRDLQSGGTWLGLSETGRFALVTNLRGFGTPKPDRVSRGKLLTDLLSGLGDYADPETAALMNFNPFNLILADGVTARFLRNRPESVRTRLMPGIFGLSNGTLDEPWAKTLRLKAALLNWLTGQRDDLEPLFAALADETLPEIGLHPDGPSDVRREAQDTPVFIRDAMYGTRCSTVVAIAKDGSGTIAERRYDRAGARSGETVLHFDWSPSRNR